MQQIGSLTILQVQRQPLKGDGSYRPEHLLGVDTMCLTQPGLLGSADGGWVVDAHHSGHPRSRGGGRRPLSIGFTAHYERMRSRFGGSAADGVAGENVIVDSDLAPTEYQLRGGIVIEARDGELVELAELRAVVPCVQFTSYLLGLAQVAAKDEVQSELDFLNGGTRGFIASTDHLTEPRFVEVGAAVFFA